MGTEAGEISFTVVKSRGRRRGGRRSVLPCAREKGGRTRVLWEHPRVRVAAVRQKHQPMLSFVFDGGRAWVMGISNMDVAEAMDDE